MKLSLAFGAALLVGMSGTAIAAEDKKSDEERIICKRIGTTGSRVGGQRICKSAEAWALERARSRQVLEDKQRDNLFNTPQGG